MASKRYLVLLVDRKRARMFTYIDGLATNHLELSHDIAPRKAKKGENYGEPQDKISRHVDDLLHKHLINVSYGVSEYAKKEKITDILIGSHRQLFKKIDEHLKYPYSKKIKAHFVTELKIPQKRVIESVERVVAKINIDFEKRRLQRALR